MQNMQITTMTTRGQIVIPQNVRVSLHIDTGTKFIVIGDEDTIILKKIEMPPLSELKTLLTKSRKQAQKAKVKKSALKQAIKAERVKS